ncbi:hypothetical protein B4119_2064 [Parageobacillus caldoxylosilyticus]|uniref:Uncharacterized protein n=1 Tax=Saccharococcus caldoxylosilyticus TaxID=81408 RepID=A0A150LCC7_9BACL|nr:hypothetical protein B4119_2064 [Parageobacillus caldoxylosilyticus]
MFLNLFTAVHERQEIPVPGTILLRGKTKKMKGLHQASRSDENSENAAGAHEFPQRSIAK